MRRTICLLLVRVVSRALAFAVELDEVHPDERPVVAELRKARVARDLKLNADGRITELVSRKLTDKHMPLVASFKELTGLDPGDAKVSDDRMVHVAKLRKLRLLVLPGNFSKILTSNRGDLWAIAVFGGKEAGAGIDAVTDEGVSHLADLSQLETLSLATTSVSDRGLPAPVTSVK